MSEALRPLAEFSAAVIEALGVGVIAVMAAYALLHGAAALMMRADPADIYKDVRNRLGHGILLGLELLVAADIIHTVAVELTFETVGVLAIVVLIRTFLSFTLEVELTGRWPWQDRDEATGAPSEKPGFSKKPGF
jgi:uncharacterized membrane protein